MIVTGMVAVVAPLGTATEPGSGSKSEPDLAEGVWIFLLPRTKYLTVMSLSGAGDRFSFALCVPAPSLNHAPCEEKVTAGSRSSSRIYPWLVLFPRGPIL